MQNQPLPGTVWSHFFILFVILVMQMRRNQNSLLRSILVEQAYKVSCFLCCAPSHINLITLNKFLHSSLAEIQFDPGLAGKRQDHVCWFIMFIRIIHEFGNRPVDMQAHRSVIALKVEQDCLSGV